MTNDRPSLAGRLRLWAAVVPLRSTLGAAAVLILAACAAYLGGKLEGWSWLGNLMAAVVVAFVTAAVVDTLLVRRRRRRIEAVVDDARQKVLHACDDVERLLRDIVAASLRRRPEPPSWLYIPISEDYRPRTASSFALERLRSALIAWTISTSYGFADSMSEGLRDRVEAVDRAFAEVDAADRRLSAAMASARPRLRVTGEPDAEAIPEAVRLERSVAADASTAARDALTASLATLTELLSTVRDNTRAIRTSELLARRVPPRLPVWLRLGLGVLSIAWATFLALAPTIPGLPSSFLEDNLLNIGADALVAVVGAAAALLLSAGHRAQVARFALPAAHRLSEQAARAMSIDLHGSGTADELRFSAQWIQDMADAVLTEYPNAELAITSRDTVADLRAMADALTRPVSADPSDAHGASTHEESSAPRMDLIAQKLSRLSRLATRVARGRL